MDGRKSKSNSNHDYLRSGVSLREIPALLDMQLHCGSSGLLFTLLFVALVGAQKIITFNPTLIFLFSVICGLFLAAIWLTAYGRAAVEKRDQRFARRLLVICGICCLFASCLLIWVTGGAASPFCAFYVMTHTLTLSNARKQAAPLELFVAFSVPIGVAFIFSHFFPALAPIDPVELNKFLNSAPYYWSIALGIIASLTVSSISRYLTARKQTTAQSANHP